MSKTIWVIVGVVVFLALLVGGVYGYQVYRENKEKKAETPEDIVLSEDQSSTSGWKVFKNFVTNYRIEYPSDMTVANASTIDEDKSKDASQSPCVKISNKYVFVIIADSTNQDEATECLRTGYGTEWSNATPDQVNIGGMQYTANGMKTEAASAGYYKAEYSTALVDERNTVFYGIDVNEKYDSAMTKAQALDLVHQILATYSPAE